MIIDGRIASKLLYVSDLIKLTTCLHHREQFELLHGIRLLDTNINEGNPQQWRQLTAWNRNLQLEVDESNQLKSSTRLGPLTRQRVTEISITVPLDPTGVHRPRHHCHSLTRESKRIYVVLLLYPSRRVQHIVMGRPIVSRINRGHPT